MRSCTPAKKLVVNSGAEASIPWSIWQPWKLNFSCEVFRSAFFSPSVLKKPIPERERIPLEPLLRALRDPHEQVRVAAARALGNLGERLPLEQLLAALHDTRDVIWAVVATLGKQETPATLKALLAVLRTGNDRARSAILHQLQKRIPIELLLELLRDQDADVRRVAAWLLGKHGEHVPVEPLLEALHDENEYVRKNALESLGQLGKPVPLEVFLALLQDEEISVSVLSIAQQLQIPLPVDVLLPFLHDDKINGYISSAAPILAAMGADAPIAKLLEILHDPSSPARLGAAQTLSLLSYPIPTEPLAAMLQKEEPESPVYSYLVFLLERHGVCLPIEVLSNAFKTDGSLLNELEAFF